MTDSGKYDINLIKTFIEGAVDTLKVQCSLEAQVGKPYKINEGSTKLPVEIVGLIGVTSKTFNGTIALCFPEKTFLGVIGAMIGENITEINQDIQDGAGELLNIIFGYTKRVLNAKGYEIAMAIPSVIRGKDIEVQQHSKVAPVIVPISTKAGDFYIKMAVN